MTRFAFSITPRKKQGCLLSQPIQACTESPHQCNNARKRNKMYACSLEEETKLSLFLTQEFLCRKKATKKKKKKVLGLIDEFKEIPGYKINMQKSNIFLSLVINNSKPKLKSIIVYNNSLQKRIT